MRVQNLGGTADNRCNCSSWLDHWERYGPGIRPRLCSVIGCGNWADVGGHVKKSFGVDNNHYIIPLCSAHNNARAGIVFEIDDFTPMAKANIAETCGKRRG